MEELKKLLEEQRKIWTDFQAANDLLIQQKAKGAVDGLLNEKVEKMNAAIGEFQSKIDAATKAAEEAQLLAKRRMEVGDGKNEEEHKAKIVQLAFDKFLRKGKAALSPEEAHAMDPYSDPDGGYFIVPYLSKLITEKSYLTSPMRQLARVETISTDVFEELAETDLADVRWKNKQASGGETSTPKGAKTIIRLGEMEAEPKVPVNLISDAAYDVEGRLNRSLSTKFGLVENASFINGDGDNQPTGILSYSAGNTWGKVEQINSGNASTLLADGILSLIYSLKSTYRNGASFVANNLTHSAIRKLKDGQGNYLWQPSFQAGQPTLLCGYPIYEFADMPDVGADALALAFANWQQAYLIVDHAQAMKVLANPYKEHGYMIWYTTKRVGGGIYNYEAIKIQKIAA